MTLMIETPGVQTTLQAAPRRGFRHFGIPAAGPADPLSMALANRLVGNRPPEAALEITYGPFEAVFTAAVSFALAGAPAEASADGRPIEPHRTHHAKAGTRVAVAPPKRGARVYLSVRGGFEGRDIKGSKATYLPAGLGGHEGRALEPGDRVGYGEEAAGSFVLATPQELVPRFSGSTVLRVVPSAEFGVLTNRARRALFQAPLTVSDRSDRMGLRLEGPALPMKEGAGDLLSSAVFPGIVQCPEGGQPIILGPDGGTTGGYPRLLSVIAPDLSLAGQIRPRSRVQFVLVTEEEAAAVEVGRRRWLEGWLGPGWPYEGLF